jgi:hypothetical protein
MKRAIFLITIAIGYAQACMACDICGCGGSSQYLGILPQNQWNFAGILYQYAGYASSHPSAYQGRPYENSADRYNTIQAWGRYRMGSKYQLFAFAPYHYNLHTANDGSTVSSGVGDVSAMLNRIVINTDRGRWTHLLQGGAGIKLPTGIYTGITTADREGLPNIQPGTGAWDILTNANYTITYGKYGANADASYRFTTPNKYRYKYGNRLSTGITGFYTLNPGRFTIMPQAGIRYEYALHDYDNFSRKWLNEQSGGYICYASAGLQSYYKRLGIKAVWQQAFCQHYGSGYVTAQSKLETGILWLF